MNLFIFKKIHNLELIAFRTILRIMDWFAAALKCMRHFSLKLVVQILLAVLEHMQIYRQSISSLSL